MSLKCTKCSQLKQNSQVLSCGHSLCQKCLPNNNYAHQFIVSCPSCSIMTILEANLPPVDTNPDNYVVCLQCKSDVMTTREFLQSPHRRHDVVSVANIVHDVQKSLRKYQLSFDLESQALYTQAQSLNKQKRIICDQYSKNSQQIQSLFSQLKNSLEISQAECLKEYQKLMVEIIGSYDQKIRQIKSQIFKCESFMQCIDHSLIKSNASKHVAATQFYFLNYAKLEESLTALIQIRKDDLNQISGNVRIRCPNLKPIHQLICLAKNIRERVWSLDQSHRDALDLKKNPQPEPESYFQLKRKQIFDLNMNTTNSSQTQAKNITFLNKQKLPKLQQLSQASRVTEPNQPYNIEGRIENLRKTLKLGQKRSSNNSKSYVNLASGYKIY